jgi:hypothetical protein
MLVARSNNLLDEAQSSGAYFFDGVENVLRFEPLHADLLAHYLENPPTSSSTTGRIGRLIPALRATHGSDVSPFRSESSAK